MLDTIKTLLGISDDSKDTLLNVLILQAEGFAKSYTHTASTDAYPEAIAQIVLITYNRLGSEGLSSESYSGVNFNYAEDLPEAIYAQLRAYRKVGVIRDVQ